MNKLQSLQRFTVNVETLERQNPLNWDLKDEERLSNRKGVPGRGDCRCNGVKDLEELGELGEQSVLG